jgi:hypothetical protein
MNTEKHRGDGIISTRGNEGACPLVHSRTASWYVAKKIKMNQDCKKYSFNVRYLISKKDMFPIIIDPKF